MKRIVSLLIVISICLMLCAPVFAAGESSPIPVTLTAYCELNGTACNIEKISGIYLDNNFYVEPEILASITGYFVEEKSERGVRLLSHNGIRPGVVIFSEKDCIETNIGDNTIITPCPAQLFDGKLYVSFVHFMKYVGASFAFYENQPIQLITIKHYDIFDAMGDMTASDDGYRFTWDEIDYGKDIDEILFNAGLVAILGEGIHPVKTILDPDSIHEDILENVLLTIVSTDCGSSTYLSNSTYQTLYDTEGLATLIGSYPDYLEVYSQNIPSGGSADLVKGALGITSLAADTIVNVMQGIELSQRYDALIEEERTILQDTIVRFSSQLSDIVMENNDDFKYIINTVTEVSAKAQDSAERNASIRNEIFNNLAIDGTSLALGIFDPFSTAINGAMSIYKVLPGTSDIIDKKTMLWNAYCSSVVQDLAFSIYANHNMTWYQWDEVQEAVENIRASDSIIGKLFSDYQMMEREDLLMYLKKAMLLQLRSTFITRQYLIASGSLDENAVNIQNEVCFYISELYYKISSCTIPSFNPDDLTYTVDLSWMGIKDAAALSAYAYFLETKEYEDFLPQVPSGYAIIDIDQDNVSELIFETVHSDDVLPYEWATYFVFYYDAADQTVKYANDSIGGVRGIYQSIQHRSVCIIGTEEFSYGGNYYYHGISDGIITEVFDLFYDRRDGSSYIDGKELTNDEFDAYMKELILIDFQSLPLSSPEIGQEEELSAYINFLKSREYEEYISNDDWIYSNPLKYAVLDIDQDGCDEMILEGCDGIMGFYNFIVFSYDSMTSKISPLSVVPISYENYDQSFNGYINYGYGVLEYSKTSRALCFSSMKQPYGFADTEYWGIDSNALQCNGRLYCDSIGFTSYESEYGWINKEGEHSPLTEDEYQTLIFDSSIVEFQPISELSSVYPDGMDDAKSDDDFNVYSVIQSFSLQGENYVFEYDEDYNSVIVWMPDHSAAYAIIHVNDEGAILECDMLYRGECVVVDDYTRRGYPKTTYNKNGDITSIEYERLIVSFEYDGATDQLIAIVLTATAEYDEWDADPSVRISVLEDDYYSNVNIAEYREISSPCFRLFKSVPGVFLMMEALYIVYCIN